MNYSKERLQKIFNKTGGRCHLCGVGLYFNNYGAIGYRGAWEIEHSNPRSLGGTDNLNNLFPAHTSCNRTKSNKSTRTERAKYGRTRAPYSVVKLQKIEKDNEILGGFAGLILGAMARTNPTGLLLFMLVGAAIGSNLEIED